MTQVEVAWLTVMLIIRPFDTGRYLASKV